MIVQCGRCMLEQQDLSRIAIQSGSDGDSMGWYAVSIDQNEESEWDLHEHELRDISTAELELRVGADGGDVVIGQSVLEEEDSPLDQDLKEMDVDEQAQRAHDDIDDSPEPTLFANRQQLGGDGNVVDSGNDGVDEDGLWSFRWSGNEAVGGDDSAFADGVSLNDGGCDGAVEGDGGDRVGGVDGDSEVRSSLDVTVSNQQSASSSSYGPDHSNSSNVAASRSAPYSSSPLKSSRKTPKWRNTIQDVGRLPKRNWPEPPPRDDRWDNTTRRPPMDVVHEAKKDHDFVYFHKSMIRKDRKEPHNVHCTVCNLKVFMGREAGCCCIDCGFGVHLTCAQGDYNTAERRCNICTARRCEEQHGFKVDSVRKSPKYTKHELYGPAHLEKGWVFICRSVAAKDTAADEPIFYLQKTEDLDRATLIEIVQNWRLNADIEHRDRVTNKLSEDQAPEPHHCVP